MQGSLRRPGMHPDLLRRDAGLRRRGRGITPLPICSRISSLKDEMTARRDRAQSRFLRFLPPRRGVSKTAQNGPGWAHFHSHISVKWIYEVDKQLLTCSTRGNGIIVPTPPPGRRGYPDLRRVTVNRSQSLYIC